MRIDLAAKAHSGGGGSTYDFVVCHGLGGHTGPNQPIKKFLFPITAIETVANFAKVAFQMLIRDPSVSSTNDVFGITDDPMYPRQKSSSGLGISKNNLVVDQGLVFGGFAIRSPSVATDRFHKLLSFFALCSTTKPVQEIVNGFGGDIRHNAHMRKPWPLLPLAVSVKRHGAQDRRFSLASTPATLPSRTEKRFVHLYQTRQLIPRIAISHCLAYLMSHQPCSLIVPNLKQPLHLSHGNAYFVHGHVVQKPIPLDQWRSGLMENGAGCYTRTIPALFAVKQTTFIFIHQRKSPPLLTHQIGFNSTRNISTTLIGMIFT